MLRAHRKAHRAAWRLLALLIPAIFLASWLSRPASRLPEPVRLAPAEPAR